MGRFTWDLIAFYAVVSIIFFIFYMRKFKSKKTSLLFTLMTVFVAREYWEIPIFFTGYFGLGNRYFPMLAHHLLVFLVFAVLVSYSKMKFTKPIIALLIVTPPFISPLLLTGLRNVYTLYLARAIGVTVFGGIFIHGSSLVRT